MRSRKIEGGQFRCRFLDDPLDRTFQFEKRCRCETSSERNNESFPIIREFEIFLEESGNGDNRRNKALTNGEEGGWRKFVGNLALIEEKLLKRVLEENWKLLEKFRTRSSAGIAIF